MKWTLVYNFEQKCAKQKKITLPFSFSYFFQALQGSLSGLNTDGNKIDIQPNKTEIKVGLQFILTV